MESLEGCEYFVQVDFIKTHTIICNRNPVSAAVINGLAGYTYPGFLLTGEFEGVTQQVFKDINQLAGIPFEGGEIFNLDQGVLLFNQKGPP